MVQEVDTDGVAFDRTSNRSSWTRFRSDEELADLAAARYPGLELERFEVVSRGVSGRVGHLRLIGAGGETVDVRGLAVRWTLDLPDTLFTAKRLEPAGRPPGWLFSGRGWGHGVGLCQVGAYGMGGARPRLSRDPAALLQWRARGAGWRGHPISNQTVTRLLPFRLGLW